MLDIHITISFSEGLFYSIYIIVKYVQNYHEALCLILPNIKRIVGSYEHM